MNIYKSRAYLVLTAIAVAMLIASVFLLPNLKLGVEFKGGSLVTIDTKQNVDTEQLRQSLLSAGFEDVKLTKFETPFGYRMEVEVPNTEKVEQAEKLKAGFKPLLENWSLSIAMNYTTAESKKSIDDIMQNMSAFTGMAYNKSAPPSVYEESFNAMYMKVKDDYQSDIEDTIKRFVSAESFKFQSVSPSLSESFIEKAKGAAIAATVVCIIVVFFIFRNAGPSIAVILGAFSDVFASLGGMALFGIPLTLPSFAALLMLVGYSLDTDILLTTRVLKRKGEIEDNAFDALKTGLTMTFMGIVSFAVLFIVSYILRISLYNQIASVALIGLFADLFATWGINAVLLMYFARRRV